MAVLISRTSVCFLNCFSQGERLSHAVGCAFAACLERKQKREKECGVTATFDTNRTTFTREGSFRVTTATEAAEREEVMRQLQDAKKGLYLVVFFPVLRIRLTGLSSTQFKKRFNSLLTF